MVFVIFLAFLLILVILRIWFQLKLKYRKYFTQKDSYHLTVAFFHPYCNAGGGGERVLWAAIRTLQIKYPSVHCVIYTGDVDASKEQILNKVAKCFNITLLRDVDFIYLNKRYLVEAKMYPYFTLLFQSIGSIVLGLEALFKFLPDVYFDSMGYAFTLPIFKYIGCCKVGCYVHYPTISTDMLKAVYEKRNNVVNNNRFISRNKYLTYLKLIYYKAFALLYGFMGRRADVIMVNSSWTKQHIISLWNKPNETYLVYPPCDVTEFQNIPLPNSDKNNKILSIAQFRPEKDHALQIKALHTYLTKFENTKNIKLILAGGCRSNEDEERVHNLQQLCSELMISKHVEFKVNLSFKDLLSEMADAGIALHSMWNEHFGIGIVESMAAGQLIIAHDSGGPKLDIVVEYNGCPTGFLANSVEKYAHIMDHIFKMSTEVQLAIRMNARKSASRFSVSVFEKSFYDSFQVLMPSQ